MHLQKVFLDIRQRARSQSIFIIYIIFIHSVIGILTHNFRIVAAQEWLMYGRQYFKAEIENKGREWGEK